MPDSPGFARAAEIERFAEAVAEFRAGNIAAERFQGMRLHYGVYSQRDPESHMVRVRIPGGRLSPAGLEAVADGAAQFSTHSRVHLTTRQDIQIYDVDLANVPGLLRRLAKAGLTTREASGNTVRNVVACAYAGICPREHVDVNPFVQGVTRHFLRNPLNQNLPRKFKISISGCEADCAQALIHDVGVVAARTADSRLGFRLLAGGGLGQKPVEAVVIEPFLEERDLLPALEALVALHDRHSDRALRSRSRLKFLVQRLGTERFAEKYREEIAHTREALVDAPRPHGQWGGGARDDTPGGASPRLFKQKQAGRYAVPVVVPLGELTATQLREIAALLHGLGLSDVRVTQDQNLLIAGVPEVMLTPLARGLERLRLEAAGGVVACRGADSCSLGITASLPLAARIGSAAPQVRVHVSGCPNGCAQPETADIGLSGFGRRHHGKLIPHYQLSLGGCGRWTGQLGFEGPAVPAARAALAVHRVAATFREDRLAGEDFGNWSHRRGTVYFDSLLADLVAVAPSEAEALARDVGHEDAFRVPPGVNECGRVAKPSALPKFVGIARERRYRNAALARDRSGPALDAAESMLHLLGTVLLLPAAQEFESLAELADVVDDALPADTAVADAFADVTARLAFLRQGADRAALERWFADLDGLVVLVADHRCQRELHLDLNGLLPDAPPYSARPRLRVATAPDPDGESTPQSAVAGAGIASLPCD
jgi:sulfite reductase (ferredoxin)